MKNKFMERYIAAKAVVGNPNLGGIDVLRKEEIDGPTSVQALPAGGSLRSLTGDGPRATRGLNTPHREFYHASVATMIRLCELAGVPDAVIKECGNIVEQCKVCRPWERPQIKPVARSEFEFETNQNI